PPERSSRSLRDALPLSTRSTPRASIRYADLLRDWDEPVFRAAAALDLPGVDPADVAAVHRVDAFVDPSLHRVGATWADVPVPAPLRTLADDLWAALDTLADHDDAGTRAELDRLRALYPYVHRKVAASPARRIARLVPSRTPPPGPPAGGPSPPPRAPRGPPGPPGPGRGSGRRGPCRGPGGAGRRPGGGAPRARRAAPRPGRGGYMTRGTPARQISA